MDLSKRRQSIRDSLRPKPINHGQLDTSLIAVPVMESHVVPERLEILKESLKVQGSNLLNLVVRRSDAYEDEEYEVVYGADWLIAAKELELEKVWVWVFDMNDEQAAATKEEMEQLLGSSMFELEGKKSQNEKDVTELLNEKLQPIMSAINKLATSSVSGSSSISADKLEQIDGRIDRLYAAVERLSKTLEGLIPKPIDLTQADPEAIDDALLRVGASDKQRKAALKAIEYWKSPNKKLNWGNLKQSMKSGADEKIRDFGSSTYNKLRQIGVIP